MLAEPYKESFIHIHKVENERNIIDRYYYVIDQKITSTDRFTTIFEAMYAAKKHIDNGLRIV